jgi:hypothetical protein
MSATLDRDEEVMRLIAHGGTALVGLTGIVSGVATAMSNLTVVLAAGLLIFGVGGLALAYWSWRGSRIGWAFAVTIDGVMGVCTLFGATKIADVARVPIGVALIPSIVAMASCVLLASFYARYDH